VKSESCPFGAPVFEPDGRINAAVSVPTLADYLWLLETGAPWSGAEAAPRPLPGVYGETAVALLCNGILRHRGAMTAMCLPSRSGVTSRHSPRDGRGAGRSVID
jgi:hypothetical protein